MFIIKDILLLRTLMFQRHDNRRTDRSWVIACENKVICNRIRISLSKYHIIEKHRAHTNYIYLDITGKVFNDLDNTLNIICSSLVDITEIISKISYNSYIMRSTFITDNPSYRTSLESFGIIPVPHPKTYLPRALNNTSCYIKEGVLDC